MYIYLPYSWIRKKLNKKANVYIDNTYGEFSFEALWKPWYLHILDDNSEHVARA